MSNPNIVNVSNIYGNTAVQAVTTSATAIVSNTAGSGKIYKVNMLMITNVSANSANITVDLYRSSTATVMTNSLTISPNAAFTPIDKTLSLYLLEGDALRCTANTNSALSAVCSWEEIN